MMKTIPSEQEIRERAYHKWLDAGRPDGDDLRFWLEAERDFLELPTAKFVDDAKESAQWIDGDETVEESFPASDPGGWPMTTIGAHPYESDAAGRSRRMVLKS